MKEDDARQKVCKQLPIVNERGVERIEYVYCIGSDCMKWKWSKPKTEEGWGYTRVSKSNDGYCGMIWSDEYENR